MGCPGVATPLIVVMIFGLQFNVELLVGKTGPAGCAVQTRPGKFTAPATILPPPGETPVLSAVGMTLMPLVEALLTPNCARKALKPIIS